MENEEIQSLLDSITKEGYNVVLEVGPGGLSSILISSPHHDIVCDSLSEADLFTNIQDPLLWARKKLGLSDK